MTSNFFAIIDGELWTAGDDVLHGTVRDIILQQCKAHDVKVHLQPPRVGDVESWNGCIVSSTSRLALPVDEVQLWDGVKFETRQFARKGLVANIDSWVCSAIDAASEAL